MWAWIIALGLLMFFLAFNLLYVKVKFAYDLCYTDGQKTVGISFVPIFDRFRWEKVIAAPVSAGEWIDLATAMIEKRSTGNKPDTDHKKTVTSDMKRNKPTRFLNVSFSNYYRLFRLFMSHLVLEKFHWETSLGLGDPMQTALACGGIWAFKGNFMGMVSHFSSIEQVGLQVQPVYDDTGLSSKLDSIFKIRIVYIMLIIISASFISVRGYIDGYSARKA